MSIKRYYLLHTYYNINLSMYHFLFLSWILRILNIDSRKRFYVNIFSLFMSSSVVKTFLELVIDTPYMYHSVWIRMTIVLSWQIWLWHINKFSLKWVILVWKSFCNHWGLRWNKLKVKMRCFLVLWAIDYFNHW